MDNKTYIESRKNKLNELKDELWVYEFSFDGKHRQTIENLKLQIKEIEKELEDNNLQDI